MKTKTSFLLAATLLLSSSIASAQQTISNGVLQAYWQNEWNKDATKVTPQLKLRYIVHNDGTSPTTVIEVPVDKKDSKNRTFIIKNFAAVPADFFQNKEGFLNQPGHLTIDSMKRTTVCASAYRATSHTSFEPDMSSGLVDTTTDEKFINCGERYPYLSFYHINPSQKEAVLKATPDDSAEKTFPFDGDTTIAKLKTVDKNWFYVALYDAKTIDQISGEKGYIKQNELTPLKKEPAATTVRHKPKPCWYPSATHDKVMRDRHCR